MQVGHPDYEIFRTLGNNKTPIIPKEYSPKPVIDYDELTPGDKEKLIEKAVSFNIKLDCWIYPEVDVDDQALVDGRYIAFEYLVYKGEIKQEDYKSYENFLRDPFGPYAKAYRMPAPWLKSLSPTSANSLALFSNTDMEALSKWTGGKIFGKHRGHRKLGNGIRILSHTGGFAVFFPPEVFHKFDIQVSISYPPDSNAECWIAGKGFGFMKMDVFKEQLQDDDTRAYIHDDISIALDRIEKFCKINFTNARGLYPDREHFTHGSYIRNSDMPRPLRTRLGGNYHITS